MPCVSHEKIIANENHVGKGKALDYRPGLFPLSPWQKQKHSFKNQFMVMPWCQIFMKRSCIPNCVFWKLNINVYNSVGKMQARCQNSMLCLHLCLMQKGLLLCLCLYLMQIGLFPVSDHDRSFSCKFWAGLHQVAISKFKFECL